MSASDASTVSISSTERRDETPACSNWTDWVSIFRVAAATSATRPAMPERSAAVRASARAARAERIWRRRMAMPARRSQRADARAGGRAAASSPSSRASAWSGWPTSRARRAARCRAWVALARSPWRSRTVRTSGRRLAGQLRSRETSAISVSASLQRALAMASPGPNRCAADLSKARARVRSPNCAMAMPRRARAAGSSRKDTRLSAPRMSPWARACPAAAITASMAIPTQVSLPARSLLALAWVRAAKRRRVNRTRQTGEFQCPIFCTGSP